MFILILYIYALASVDNNVALTNVKFGSQKACIAAGNSAVRLTEGTAKNVRFVCVKEN